MQEIPVLVILSVFAAAAVVCAASLAYLALAVCRLRRDAAAGINRIAGTVVAARELIRRGSAPPAQRPATDADSPSPSPRWSTLWDPPRRG